MAKDNSSKESSLDMLRNLLNCPPKDKVTELSNLVLSGSSIIELENRKFYRYQKPDYTSHISCNLQLLGPFWNAQDYEDKEDLCKFVESNLRSQKLSSQSLREEIRGYLYMLMDNFDPHHHESHWRLYGPFWLMEKLQLTDCLDLVLESLRQDAFFYYNYFIGFGEWISALIYQLGRNQLDKLEKFMYEQGLIPGVKPIVFDAIRARLWKFEAEHE